ncbi:hypothetical protein [Shinella kummerowiae]|uniref:hypothetical protein n=1 Tax=Shinella kummerowiae TaxID=417745 RepID=UPI0021B6B672|nr:hypothetical protein [Shinella kummerowiae]MCT7662258.1 hypothetical protein [Shinella kummerowiae]
MSERDIVLLTLLFITAVWAVSATLIAAYLTGRQSLAAWLVADFKRTFRKDAPQEAKVIPGLQDEIKRRFGEF